MIAVHELFDVEQIWIEARQKIETHSSLQTPEMFNESFINGETSLFEELTASGDFSRIEFEGDQAQVHRATLQRLLNGWNESAPQWEKRRRFWEICEELTVYGIFCKVQSGELPEDTVVGTISNIPDGASEDEIHDEGYRPLNQKGMVRTYHFEKTATGWRRVLEQVSRSNSNDTTAHEWLVDEGIYSLRQSEAVLANQFVTTQRHLPDRAISIVMALDARASEDVLYGEPRAEALRRGRPEYHKLREVSRQRRDQLSMYSEEMAEHDVALQGQVKRHEITYQKKLWKMRQEQTKLIDRILLLAPEYARDARGELSARYWYRASLDFAHGDFEAAERNVKSANEATDPRAASVCGGGGKNPEEASRLAKETVEKAKEDKKKWKWKQGVCQVKTCRKKAEVGPCSVCRSCQYVFDKGGDPTKVIFTIEKSLPEASAPEEPAAEKVDTPAPIETAPTPEKQVTIRAGAAVTQLALAA